MSAGINSRSQAVYFDETDRLWKTRIAGEINVTADIENSTTPIVYNVAAPTAATEYSQALTANTKQFIIKVRGNADLQLSFTSGESGTKFITIPCGASYKESSLDLSSVTLYFQVDQASQTVEILEWS